MTSPDAGRPQPDALESRDFYEVCQQYRHSLMGHAEFEALKAWIRKNAAVHEKVTDPEYETAAEVFARHVERPDA